MRSYGRFLVLLALLGGAALAHQEVLFARIGAVPLSPAPGEPFELIASLRDPAGRPVTGLDLEIRLYREAGDGEEVQAAEASLEAGRQDDLYTGTLDVESPGAYRIEIVELVDGEIESSASGESTIDGSSPLELELVLPPSGGGLGNWLLWLVGLPALAGILVTILVLTGGRKKAESE